VIALDMMKEKYIRGLIESIKDINYIMPDDIPNIDLYMDQVTTFMDKKLKSSKRYSEDKLLTKTMINNYTKNELLPPPNRKKYSKDHMLLLIFIYYFKNVLSISDIQSIFDPLTQRYYGDDSKVKLEDIYEEIFNLEKEQSDAITKDMIRKITKAKESFPEVKEDEDRDFLTMFSFISTLCFDVYMKKQIIEKLIDHSMMGEKSDKVKQSTESTKKTTNKTETAKKNEPAKKTETAKKTEVAKKTEAAKKMESKN